MRKRSIADVLMTEINTAKATVTERNTDRRREKYRKTYDEKRGKESNDEMKVGVTTLSDQQHTSNNSTHGTSLATSKGKNTSTKTQWKQKRKRSGIQYRHTEWEAKKKEIYKNTDHTHSNNIY